MDICKPALSLSTSGLHILGRVSLISKTTSGQYIGYPNAKTTESVLTKTSTNNLRKIICLDKDNIFGSTIHENRDVIYVYGQGCTKELINVWRFVYLYV